METMKQQLYERKGLPEEFYPNDSIVFTLNTEGTLFTTDKTYNECKLAAENGILFLIKNFNKFYICTSIEVINNQIIVIFDNHYRDNEKFEIYEYKCIYKSDNSKTCIKSIKLDQYKLINAINIDSIVNEINNNNAKENVLNAINAIFTNFYGFINSIKEPNTILYGIGGKSNAIQANNRIILTWTDAAKITIIVISNDGSYNKHYISFNDTTLYRTSNLNIEPITNPKIWVGTAVQYAAIGTKDNNTTYIIKTDS